MLYRLGPKAFDSALSRYLSHAAFVFGDGCQVLSTVRKQPGYMTLDALQLWSVLNKTHMPQGALGLGDFQDAYEPEDVAVEANIVGIGSGHFHSLVISSEGDLWSWGYIVSVPCVLCVHHMKDFYCLLWCNNDLVVQSPIGRPAW